MAVQVGELVFKMAADVARLQSDMAKARGVVDNTMQGIKGAASIARTALGAVGVALSAGSFVSMIKGSIDAMDQFGKLAQRTGNTVEALSSLKPAARAAGIEFEAVAISMGKLAKNMLEASDTGKGKAASAFEELGIKLTDVNGKLRPTVEVMKEAADKLSAMEEKTRAVGLAQEIFGKSGATLLPFLAELARMAELHASMTTKQVEEAHKFNVQLDEMLAKSTAVKREMATGLLPALNDILKALSETTEKGDGVRSFFETLGTLLRGIAQLANLAWAAIRTLGETIGMNLAVMDRLLHLDFKGAVEVMKAYADQIKRIGENAAKTASTIDGVKDTVGGPGGGGSGDLGSLSEQPVLAGGSAGNDRLGSLAASLDVSKSTIDEVGHAFESAANRAVHATNEWRGAVRGLAQDLMRMAARKIAEQARSGISSAVTGIVSSMIGGDGEVVEARAGGGPVSGGSSYLVGENGPELFTPGSSGGITPNGALGGSGDLVVNMYAPGADAAALGRLQAQVRQLHASFGPRTIEAMRTYLAQRGSALA